MKTSNNSFITFAIQSSGAPKYLWRKDVTTMKAWYFDQTNKLIYYGNGTEIFNCTLNVTKNA